MQLKSGIVVGRPFGIPLRVHGSWFPAVLLLVLHFTLTMYAELHPAGAVLLALATAFAVFASLVAHELGHALVARSLGIRVADITLFIFGGVARIAREPTRPAQEIVIAIAGPIVSFAIGVAALGLAGDGVGVTGMFLWTIGAANIAIGTFNLLPGFPLDGGRILRALLWSRSKDLHRATAQAGRIGQGMGMLLAAAGLSAFFLLRDTGGGEEIGGLWLAVIGVFLVFLASSARRASRITASLAAESAGTWARPFAGTLELDSTLSKLVPEQRAPYAVSDGGRLAGVVIPGTLDGVSTIQVRELMVPWTPGLTFPAAGPLTRALERLAGEPAGLLVIVDNQGSVVGVLDRDGVRTRLSERA